MRLTNDELQTLRSFGARPEGRAWVELLKKMLGDADAKLRRASGEELLRCQGRAQQLDELISLVNDAPQALKRPEQPRPTTAWR
jgi:hypothetical protein